MSQYRRLSSILLLGLVWVTHLHQGFNFSRPLSALDDTTFVLPLKDMTFHRYFSTWLFAKDKYAFPLRDLSFWLDFQLQNLLGVATFWVTNLFLFSLLFFLLLRFLRLIFPDSQYGIFLFLALWALHPLNVEVLQWVYIRKHLLPAVFLCWATLDVLLVKHRNRRPTARHWAKWVGAYLLSLLSFPSGVLWVLWPFFVFRSELKKNRGWQVTLAGVGLLAVTYVVYVVKVNPDYGRALQVLATDSILLKLQTLALATGRGFWNFLAPYPLAIYYNPHNPKNLLGFLSLLVALVLVVTRLRQWRKKWPNNRRLALDLVGLILFLFLPNFFVVLNFHGFVWADRYYFLILPWLLLLTWILICPRASLEKKRPPSPNIPGIFVPLSWGLAGVYLFASVVMVRAWATNYRVMDHCTHNEGSAKCVILSMEAGLERNGCEGLLQSSRFGEEVYQKSTSDFDFVFRYHYPFYVSLCSALEKNVEPAARWQNIEKLKQMENPLATAFGEVLFFLRSGNLEKAYQLATQSYLNIGGALRFTYKTASYYRGQGLALCEMLGGEKKGGCETRVKGLFRATNAFYPRPDLVEWARRQNLASYRRKK